jgi:hypothetical protein
LYEAAKTVGALFAEDMHIYALIIPEPQDAAQVYAPAIVGIQRTDFCRQSCLTTNSNIPARRLCMACAAGTQGYSRADRIERIPLVEKGVAWWRNRRYCDRHNLFYYVHRTENGMKAKIPVIGLEPVMTPN